MRITMLILIAECLPYARQCVSLLSILFDPWHFIYFGFIDEQTEAEVITKQKKTKGKASQGHPLKKCSFGIPRWPLMPELMHERLCREHKSFLISPFFPMKRARPLGTQNDLPCARFGRSCSKEAHLSLDKPVTAGTSPSCNPWPCASRGTLWHSWGHSTLPRRVPGLSLSLVFTLRGSGLDQAYVCLRT